MFFTAWPHNLPWPTCRFKKKNNQKLFWANTTPVHVFVTVAANECKFVVVVFCVIIITPLHSTSGGCVIKCVGSFGRWE